MNGERDGPSPVRYGRSESNARSTPLNLKVLVLPGDGIGPEVTREAVRVLGRVAALFGHHVQLEEGLIGAAAIQQSDLPLPETTTKKALQADAVLLGAVGLPEFDEAPPSQRPEQGLLGLRQTLSVYANLRPVRSYAPLLGVSPLKERHVSGTDFVVVRELTGGLYYGTPRGLVDEKGESRAFNTMSYTRSEIERIATMAFELAMGRRRRLTSVDKSNVLETSQLWRRVVTGMAGSYPEIALDHMLVDNCAMQLILNPQRFDVLLTPNLFGDILSDEAAMLCGSIGMLASASLGQRKASGIRAGLYEPVHGSAPDIRGQGRANPLGAIGSVSALFEFGLGRRREAEAISHAIETVLEEGKGTSDLALRETLTTAQMGQAVCEAIHP
ncbi:MAG: 3-isopropylmalate dehydrogenase [Acidobacteriota bacterium]